MARLVEWGRDFEHVLGGDSASPYSGLDESACQVETLNPRVCTLFKPPYEPPNSSPSPSVHHLANPNRFLGYLCISCVNLEVLKRRRRLDPKEKKKIQGLAPISEFIEVLAEFLLFL